MKFLLRLPRRWLVLGTVAVVLAGIWFLSPGNPTLRLPDGREVTVLDVTYGTNHMFVDGPLLVRLAWRYLPRVKAYRWGLFLKEQQSPVPTCMVWAKWRIPRGSSVADWASVRDQRGIESEPTPALVRSGMQLDSVILAWQFANYPRGQGKCLFRFYNREGYSSPPVLVGELPVRFPKQRGAAWNAPAPPVVVTNEGMTFSLVDLRSGGDSRPLAPSSSIFIAPWTRARFAVSEGGQPSAAWTIRSLDAMSALGNRFYVATPLLEKMERSDGSLVLAFPNVLWPEEPGWNFRTEFSRCRDYAPEDLVTIKSVPVWRGQPIPETVFFTNFQAAVGGVSLAGVRIGGVTSIRPFVRGAYHPNAELILLYTSRVDQVRVNLARAVDNAGRDARFGHERDVMPGRYTAALELAADVTAVDLTVAVHRSRFIDFLVRPIWAPIQPPGDATRPHPATGAATN